MLTTASVFTKTLVEKQSKFIACLFPYHSFSEGVLELRAAHPKARHFVTGYRYLNQYDQIVEGCSDDGEPKGTSGKPTLSVIQGHKLINVGLVTIRYFGGTKLGTGGLVRAYSDVANMVIDSAELVQYRKEVQETVSILYKDMGKVEYLFEQTGLQIVEKQFGATEGIFTLRGTRELLDTLYSKAESLLRKL